MHALSLDWATDKGYATSVGLQVWPCGSGDLAELADRFQRRPAGGLSLTKAAGVITTDPLTTLAMSEQLVKDVELRTFGEAVTLVGTVQVALNEADRWTSVPPLADCLAAGGSSEGVVVRKMEESCSVIGVDEGLFRIGGVGGGFTDMVGGVKYAGMEASFLGEGVQEFAHC